MAEFAFEKRKLMNWSRGREGREDKVMRDKNKEGGDDCKVSLDRGGTKPQGVGGVIAGVCT